MSKTQTERLKVRNDHPDSWIPIEAGDSIAGRVADVTDAWSDQRRDPTTNKPGSSYPLLTLQVEEANGYEDEQGRLPDKLELKVHCFGAILFNEIMRKQPGIGERIRITYQGTGEAKPGQNAPEKYMVRAASNTDVARRAYDAIGPQQGHKAATPEQPEPSGPDPDEDIPF